MTSVRFLEFIGHVTSCSTLFILHFNLLLLLPLIPLASTVDSAIAKEWNTSHSGKVVWRNGCTYSNDVKSLSSTMVNITLEECGNQCLHSPMTCNHFHFNHNDDNGGGNCFLYWGRKETKPSTLESWLASKYTCGYIPSQMWSKSNEDDRMLVKSNCSFPSTTALEGQGVIRNVKSFNACRSACLEDHRCIAFSYNRGDHKCIIPQKSSEFEKRKGPLTFLDLFRLRRPILTPSPTANCYVVSTRDWELDANTLSAGRVFFKENCDFKGFDIENPTDSHPENNKEPACRRSCLHNPQCTHFSFYKNGTCYLKNAPRLTHRLTNNEAGQCGYIPDKLDNWNFTKTGNVSVMWRNNCDFEDLKVIADGKKCNTTMAVCREECVNLDMCNHFSHDGTDCYPMFNFELAQPTTEGDKKGWTCGYVPNRIWEHSNGDKRILQRKVCTFTSLSTNGTDVTSNESSFNSCRNACLEDHQCNAFSYDKDERKCVKPHKASEFKTNFKLSYFNELLQSRSPTYSWSSECVVIPTRNWKTEVIHHRSNNDDSILYQNDCDFTKGNDIANSMDQKSYSDCASHCFSMPRCTHFTYQEQNGICNLRNAPVLTDRVAVKGGDRICGYIPSRWNLTADDYLVNR